MAIFQRFYRHDEHHDTIILESRVESIGSRITMYDFHCGNCGCCSAHAWCCSSSGHHGFCSCSSHAAAACSCSSFCSCCASSLLLAGALPCAANCQRKAAGWAPQLHFRPSSLSTTSWPLTMDGANAPSAQGHSGNHPQDLRCPLMPPQAYTLKVDRA